MDTPLGLPTVSLPVSLAYIHHNQDFCCPILLPLGALTRLSTKGTVYTNTTPLDRPSHSHDHSTPGAKHAANSSRSRLTPAYRRHRSRIFSKGHTKKGTYRTSGLDPVPCISYSQTPLPMQGLSTPPCLGCIMNFCRGYVLVEGM